MMLFGRLQIEWFWRIKWISPRYGLKLTDYLPGMSLWIDGQKGVIVRINYRKNKVKVRSLK